MSYNTRRTGARMGPQVNYHQAPQSAPQRQTPSRQMQQNPGYNTTSGGNYGQGSFSSQGYSSVQQAKQPQQVQQQPPPQPPPQQQQQQQQPPPQAPPAPPVNPPQPPVQQQQQQQPPLPSQSMLQPKSEVQTSPTSQNPSSDASAPTIDDKSETNGEGGEVVKKKPFWFNKNRSGPAFKISRKMKRRRQNARLRKMLTPKNALMVLNELHQGIKFTVTEQVNALGQSVYSVTVLIDGKQHHGQGMSKGAAKQVACENALKSLLLAKMGKSIQDASEPMDQSQSEADEGTKSEADDNMDGSSVSSYKSKRTLPEDDVPWGCLASFALHKLFTEWQNQGIEVPIVPQGRTAPPPPPPPMVKPNLAVDDSALQTGAGRSPQPMKKLPEDASKCNPVQLLNQLKPGSQYTEQRDGLPPNLTFTMSIIIDGQEFVGVASNKKDAKRECARAALAKMGILTN